MDKNKFYVYEWFNTETGEVFYVGKGHGKRAYTTSHRNKIFEEYYKINPCDVRFAYTDLSEQEAFAKEKELIKYYKHQNQCQANLAEGGKGGCHFVWTPEMREYYSKYNPMKSKEQRERMSKENPMKNPSIAQRVGNAHKRAVIVNGVRYDGVVDAAKALKISCQTMQQWLKRGYDSENTPCRYEDEEQRQFTPTKRGKSILIDGVKYDSLTIGAQALGVTASAISYALSHSKICKGHKVEYVNQQPSQ